MTARIQKTIRIHARPSAVWDTLTRPDLMKQWMGEPEMEIEVHTDWSVNSPFVITGFHHIRFENRGTVLTFEPGKKLAYTHRSSVSRLPDKPESYTIFEFTLSPQEDQVELSVDIRNFPTETIYKHLEFYWATTLSVIREVVEKQH